MGLKLNLPIRRGDIYYADLSPVIGSEQGGIRPVLVIQNDVGNRHSPTLSPVPSSRQRPRHTQPKITNPLPYACI